MQNHDFNVNTHKENNKMEYLTDIDEFQAALKMVNVNEDMNVTKSNNVLLEGVELDCYHKCQKILDTPEMKKCHKRCLDVNFDELNESDIDTINELYDLGIERGLINPDTESEPEDNAEGNQMVDPNVQEPLKDVGDGCEMDDVDGDTYWDMKKALRECGEYGSIDKTIEEEIMDEEYPTDVEKPNMSTGRPYKVDGCWSDEHGDTDEVSFSVDATNDDDAKQKIIDYFKENYGEVGGYADEITFNCYVDGKFVFSGIVDNGINDDGVKFDTKENKLYFYENENPTGLKTDIHTQSDEHMPDGYDDDELIAALSDKDVAPTADDMDKMEKPISNPPADDMPFEAQGDDVEADSEDNPVADDSSTEDDGDEVQDDSTGDSEDATDDGEDEGEDDTATEPEEDSTDDTETSDTTDTETTSDDTTDNTSTEDAEDVNDDAEIEDADSGDETEDTEDDDEKEEDSTEDETEEDKPEEKDLTADDKAQLKNEYTNMFSDIVKGMLSEVEPEEGKKAELCVKDMTPEQKSEFWNKVAEQWEGKADPADFMSASELESLEKQVEKKEKEESSKED